MPKKRGLRPEPDAGRHLLQHEAESGLAHAALALTTFGVHVVQPCSVVSLHSERSR